MTSRAKVSMDGGPITAPISLYVATGVRSQNEDGYRITSNL
jgi:hypothetical protein